MRDYAFIITYANCLGERPERKPSRVEEALEIGLPRVPVLRAELRVDGLLQRHLAPAGRAGAAGARLRRGEGGVAEDGLAARLGPQREEVRRGHLQ